MHRSQPHVARLRLPAVFDEPDLKFLSRAIARVHGIAFSEAMLAAAHRPVSQILGPMLTLQSSMAFARVDGAHGERTAAVMSMRAGLSTLQAPAIGVRGPASKTAAFLTPLQVHHALLQSIDTMVARFRQEFQSHIDSGFTSLPNYNIDSGLIARSLPGESAA